MDYTQLVQLALDYADREDLVGPHEELLHQVGLVISGGQRVEGWPDNSDVP